jgi:hypothetical protein
LDKCTILFLLCWAPLKIILCSKAVLKCFPSPSQYTIPIMISLPIHSCHYVWLTLCKITFCSNHNAWWVLLDANDVIVTLCLMTICLCFRWWSSQLKDEIFINKFQKNFVC